MAFFRIDPVPGISKRHWRFGSYYKRPRTTQEARFAYAHGRYIRAKRNARNLPSAYDDIAKCRDVRSRKSYRTHQHKPGN
jgi:hypothetical protein